MPGKEEDVLEMKEAPAERSESRAVVSFVDGTWTDRLVATCVAIENVHHELRLVLEIAPRPRKAGADRDFERFLAHRHAIDSLMLVKPPFRGRLAERVRHAEDRRLSVLLRAGGEEVLYPATAVFGPDGITLTFG